MDQSLTTSLNLLACCKKYKESLCLLASELHWCPLSDSYPCHYCPFWEIKLLLHVHHSYCRPNPSHLNWFYPTRSQGWSWFGPTWHYQLPRPYYCGVAPLHFCPLLVKKSLALHRHLLGEWRYSFSDLVVDYFEKN